MPEQLKTQDAAHGDDRDARRAAPPLIEIRGVSKRYTTRDGEVFALDETSIDIAEGEFVSIVGPSGCGKSTLLMLTSGLIRASSGEIRIGGTPITKPYTDLGIVFQQDLLMDWRTTMNNVLIQAEFRGVPKKAMAARAHELLASVGLGDFEAKYPYELSGGMRQRVAICRALVHDPRLLLMDEPFGALDALTREQLNLDLQNIWQEAQKTVLFITHSIGEAIFLSDRVLVFGPRPGRIVDELYIDLPRPRRLAARSTERFGEYTERIRSTFQSMGVIKEQTDGRA
jgi:NitT/TauT family transport system ATP-binding protein